MNGRRDRVTWRPVVPDDDALLLRLYTQTRAAELASVPWSDDQKAAFVRQQFEAQRADYRSRFPASEHFVLCELGEPVGRVWIDRRSDEIRLLDIIVDERRQGRGIGRAVLESLIDEATSAGAALRHSVLTANEGALRFYRRLGFVEIDDLEMYVLMEWRPSGAISRPG